MPRSGARETGPGPGAALSPPAARHLALGLASLALVTVLGAAGYALLEGMSASDALYMSVITLSTVGYEEVRPLSPAGRWYTMGLIVVGLGVVFYTVGALAEFLLAGRLRELFERRAAMRAIESLVDHVIVCGFGRFGRAVVEQLEHGSIPLVVIDPDPAVQAECDRHALLHVPGSALDEEVLARAGIARARAVVAATPSDADNVFVALQAREANPRIQIHARAETAAGVRRLHQAGAGQVVSPHQIGGHRIANAIVRTGGVEFLELTSPGSGVEISLEEVAISEGSPAAHLALSELAARDVHVSVVAIKRGDERIRLKPGSADVLEPGDRVIAVGDRASLERLASLAGGS